MTPQEITQLKAISLQAAAGNLANAKDIFFWLTENTIEAEVQRRVAAMFPDTGLTAGQQVGS
jgi:hypothetical protein